MEGIDSERGSCKIFIFRAYIDRKTINIYNKEKRYYRKANGSPQLLVIYQESNLLWRVAVAFLMIIIPISM